MRDPDLGATLRAHREAHGLSQAAIAGVLGCTPQQVSHMERAGRRLKVEDVAAYAHAMGERIVIEIEPEAGGTLSELRAAAADLTEEDRAILLRFARAMSRASAKDKKFALGILEEQEEERATGAPAAAARRGS